ncbi:hypothetical protein Taro_000527 [Colocasia esculenta]|uniref:RRM domain-containing protein n=1 Tax=Colocasia esculenta TaxID=4460 RepID=A0A843TCA9_COLES|nr:hypothetical protein [Colocasia esculenta]
MSRLCVKNLPKYVGEERLREFFSQKGEVTDAKLMRTKDGKSRRFAFIGFRSEQESEEAIRFFNNTYMDTCRITCEVARKVGDPNIPRPWSRYSAKDSQLSEKNVGTEGKGICGVTSPNSKRVGDVNGAAKTSESYTIANDPHLQEFLQIMQPRVKSKLWSNDTLAPSVFADKEGQNEGREANLLVGSRKQPAQVVSDKTDGSNRKGQTDPVQSLRDIHNETSETLPERKLHELTQDAVISDMDYFKSRVKKDWSDSEDDEEENTDAEKNQELDVKESQMSVIGQQARADDELFDDDPVGHSCGSMIQNEKAQPEHSDHSEQPVTSSRLFIRNLSYTTRMEVA